MLTQADFLAYAYALSCQSRPLNRQGSNQSEVLFNLKKSIEMKCKTCKKAMTATYPETPVFGSRSDGSWGWVRVDVKYECPNKHAITVSHRYDTSSKETREFFANMYNTSAQADEVKERLHPCGEAFYLCHIL